MTGLRRVAVFCGSSAGVEPALLGAAYDVGRGLAEREVGLVYGGGGSGLMGSVSQGALDAGGEVIGVIPGSMVEREWGRHDLTRLDVVDTMHERKALMAEEADAFLVLPGGIGTLEEFFEVWTWRTLGYHAKPVGLLDVGGFWGPLLATLTALVEGGFVATPTLADLVVAPDLAGALAGLSERSGA